MDAPPGVLRRRAHDDRSLGWHVRRRRVRERARPIVMQREASEMASSQAGSAGGRSDSQRSEGARSAARPGSRSWAVRSARYCHWPAHQRRVLPVLLLRDVSATDANVVIEGPRSCGAQPSAHRRPATPLLERAQLVKDLKNGLSGDAESDEKKLADASDQQQAVERQDICREPTPRASKCPCGPSSADLVLAGLAVQRDGGATTGCTATWTATRRRARTRRVLLLDRAPPVTPKPWRWDLPPLMSATGAASRRSRASGAASPPRCAAR